MVDTTVPDSIGITADLKCGATASYHFSTEASYAGPHKIELYGSKGALVYTLFSDEVHGATAGMSSMQPIEPDADEIRLQGHRRRVHPGHPRGNARPSVL